MTTQMKKEQYATCEECERLCYTGGEHEEGEEYICEDCEEEECCRDCGNECGECCCDYGNPELARLRDGEEEEEEEEIDVDDRDAPNTFPYKKCSVCGERKSCGKYMENDWFCENCAEEAEEEERFVCSVCGKIEPKDVEWNVGAFEDFRGEVICPECAEEAEEEELCGCAECEKCPSHINPYEWAEAIHGNPENVAQFTAFVQANFTREELFPETKPIATSDSISGEVSRELETLQAQNAKLVAENQKLQQQLVAIKSLLHAN